MLSDRLCLFVCLIHLLANLSLFVCLFVRVKQAIAKKEETMKTLREQHQVRDSIILFRCHQLNSIFKM